MTQLSKSEQADLRQVLESPLLRKALLEALGEVYREKAGASTLEGCAMAYSATEGARSVLNKLLFMAEIRDEISAPSTRRLRTIQD